MQFVAHNVAKEELDSTPATVARTVVRKVEPCVRALIICILKFYLYCVGSFSILLLAMKSKS